MGYARKAQICLQDTPFYHCIARCVRRAWLWGIDEYAGRDYSHRKQWVIDRLQQLVAIFAIDVCSYVVMSNHYHLILHVDLPRARQWSPEEVIDRWGRIFRTGPLIERWQQGLASPAESAMVMAQVEIWRARLTSISWFMRCLNEHLARRANAEDGCTGRFWEGRFKSQALLDEAGLLTAMAYVDLNPVRAGIADTPETSVFTSIYQRVQQLKELHNRNALQTSKVPHATGLPLLPFKDEAGSEGPCIPYDRLHYLQLLDWTGRAVRVDKVGFIDGALPSIMQRLQIDPHRWQHSMRVRGNLFGRALGRLDRLRAHANTLGQSWIRGLQQAHQLFG